MTITTQVRFGRDLNDAERNIIIDGLNNARRAGTHDGNPTRTDAENALLRTTRRIWTTSESATAWIALLNTFVPPPNYAAVVEE